MWYIFLREISLDRDAFQSINAEILIGNNFIRPWYDQDGNFPLAMREAFKWRIDYPEDEDRMNANFDFWFDEMLWKIQRTSYLSSEKVIDHGNCLSIQTVLSLQVDRVVIEETETDDAVFSRLDLIQSSLNIWGPALARYTMRTYAAADQIFINYGKTYAVTGFNLYSFEHL
jgi:hypothetical protein